MIFQGRYEKARKLQQEQMEGRERAFDDEMLEKKLEKGDTLAMILSALAVFVPAALVFLGIVSAIGYFFIAR